jgi:hypothetical protein
LGARSLTIVAIVSASALTQGCRSDPAPPPLLASSVTTPPPDGATPDDGVDAGLPAPTVESLALMVSALAPGMRELARGESPLPATIPLEPTGRDTCVRVVLGASAAVVGALVSDKGRVLDVTEAGRTTVLGQRGPVCLRKDQAATIEVQGPASPVRYVVWVSP